MVCIIGSFDSVLIGCWDKRPKVQYSKIQFFLFLNLGTLDKRLKYATIRVVSRKCCLEFYSLYNLSPGVFCTLGMDGYICKVR